MPFHRTDDQMHGHPKARRAGLPALGLWVMAASHSMAYKQDGFVPDWFVTGWPNGKKAADKLIDAGLWIADVKDGEGGYRFHDWHDYNPTSDEIERDRERARERQRESRRRLREGKRGDKGESQ